MNYTPLPKEPDHDDQTNVWSSAAPDGMVSLHVNDTTVNGTWMDAVVLAYTIFYSAGASAQQLGVSSDVYQKTLTELRLLVDRGWESAVQWK